MKKHSKDFEPIWILIRMAILFHEKPQKADVVTIIAVLIGIVCFFVDCISGGGIVLIFILLYNLLTGNRKTS